MDNTKKRQFGRRSFLNTTALSMFVIGGVNLPVFSVAKSNIGSEQMKNGPASLDFDFVMSDQSWLLDSEVHYLLQSRFQSLFNERNHLSKPLLLVLPMAETEPLDTKMEEPLEALRVWPEKNRLFS